MPKNKRKVTSSKTFNIIISILVAIFLWVYVIAEVNPLTQQTMAAIPVQLLNTEGIANRDLALAGEQSFTVDVVIEGKRREAVQVTSGQIVVTADLSGYGKGDNQVPVSVAVPEGMTILEIRPANINVTIEELITASKPVKIKFVGTASAGTEPGAIAISPLTLDVTGAKSAVNTVSALEAAINITDLNSTERTIQAVVTPVDKEGNKVENLISSTENVSVTGKLLATKEVKLNVEITGQLNPLYEIKFIDIPGTMRIKGDLSLLTSLTVIQAEPIDISQLNVSSQIQIVPILPTGIEAAFGSEILSADIGIQEMATQVFTYSGSEIMIQGLDPTLKASVKALQITVTVSGSQAIISGLVKEDIKPYVDLSGKLEGVGNQPVSLSYTKQIDGVISDPAEVFVEISK